MARNFRIGTLATKIDFPSVRASMRPVVTQKVSEGFERYQSQIGPTGALIMAQLKQEAIPRIVDTSLSVLLTPQMLLRLINEGSSVKETLDRIMREQMGRGLPGATAGATEAPVGGQPRVGDLLGRLLKGAASPQTNTDSPQNPTTGPGPVEKRPFGLSNIKSFSLNGPLSFRVGVAKDGASNEPDATAEISFTGGDWKLTGLVPRLQ